MTLMVIKSIVNCSDILKIQWPKDVIEDPIAKKQKEDKGHQEHIVTSFLSHLILLERF